MKKRSIILLFVSLLLIVIPFFFNTYSIIRLISVTLGLIFLILSILFNKKSHIVLVVILPILVFTVSYALDLFLFYSLKRIPIYINKVDSSDKVSTYNSFFYRIYNCNKELIMDYGYNREYSCDNDYLEAIDINELLLNPSDSYTKYKNKFIRVHGKISKIVNLDSIELSLWDKADNSLNGYVNFNYNYVLKVPVKEDLNNLRIYEEIDVIGRVSKLNNDTLYLIDTKLIPSDVYDTWSYEIIQNNDLKYENIIDNYYYYGISELNIMYSDDLIYELGYLINDKKITIDDLIKGKFVNNLYKDEESKVTGEEYILEKFNVLRCSNDIVIISNKKNKLDINSCLINK